MDYNTNHAAYTTLNQARSLLACVALAATAEERLTDDALKESICGIDSLLQAVIIMLDNAAIEKAQ